MAVINGEAPTPDAARVMRRLCRHWSHKFAVRFDDHTGEIQINDVKVAMRVAPSGGRMAWPVPATKRRPSSLSKRTMADGDRKSVV